MSAFAALLMVLAMGATQRRSSRLEWGLYQILWSGEFHRQLADEIAKFDSLPDYVMFYRDLGRPFPRWPIERISKHGATAVVSLELWTWHGGRRGSYLTAIRDGAYDAFFRQWATDAKAYGKRVLLRFGFEFNGDWFTWSGDPGAYVAAWRHVHNIFNKVGAHNVEWVWAPNVVSCPNVPGNDMHLYYPGDAHVDWVAVDGYNFGDHHDQWHKWQSFEEVLGGVLDDLARRYSDKPIMVAEFGCAPGTTKQRASWIRDAFASLDRRPRVLAAIWFNLDKRREGEPNWRIDVTPESLDAFNDTFAAPAKD